MVVHNLHAVRRNIRFVEHVAVQARTFASDRCCWNCLQSVMTYECLWCEREKDSVDIRDLCAAWQAGDAEKGKA